jgi:DNA-binding transcriptional MerR regulator
MFRIGEFSKLSLVTVKALRYYDSIAAPRPASVDHFTNYRCHSAGRLPGLNRILAPKDLALTLDEIGRPLGDDLPPEQMRGTLRLVRVEIRG